MAGEKNLPAAPMGAGAATVEAPAVREIEETAYEVLYNAFGGCGPIDIRRVARWVAEDAVEIVKKRLESRRKRLEDLMDLIVEEVYMSGNMALNTKPYVERIMEVLLEGL